MESFQTLLKSPTTPNGITTTRFLASLNSADSAHVHISDLDTLALVKVDSQPTLDVPIRKRRKLRLKKMSDSDSSTERQSPVAKATHSKEEIRRRKLIVDNLKALELCFNTSKEIKSCIFKSFGGSGADAEKFQSTIANGSCSITTATDFQNGVDDEIVEAPMFDKLKRYQQCGIRWLQCLYSVVNANGILADEMGLGKTAQTCVFLSWLYMKNPNASCTLIVVPTSILDSWALELEKWAPNLKGKIVKYHGSPSMRVNVACEALDMYKKGRVSILISTIATVSMREDVKMLRGLKEFEYLVVDEAHALKNSETIAYRRLTRCFNIKHRLLLTGTPVQNKPDELGNLLQFAMPNTFDQAKVAAAIDYIAENPLEAAKEVPGIAELSKISTDGTETPKKTIVEHNNMVVGVNGPGRGDNEALVSSSKGKVVDDAFGDGGDSLGESGQPFTSLGVQGGGLEEFTGSGGAITDTYPLTESKTQKEKNGHTDGNLHWLDATLESLLTNHLTANRKHSDHYQTSSPQQHSHLPQATTILIPPDLNSAENSPTSVSVSVAESAPKVQKLESRRFHGVATVENLTRYYEHYKAASAAASAASTPISKPVDGPSVSGNDFKAPQMTEDTLASFTRLQEAPPLFVPIYDFDEDARNSFNQVGVNKQRLLQCMKQLPLALQNSRDSSVCEQKSGQFQQTRNLQQLQHWNDYQENQQELEMYQGKRIGGSKVIACAGEMSDEPMASSGGFASGNRTRGTTSPSSSSSATATATVSMSATAASANELASWRNYDVEYGDETARESDQPFTSLQVQDQPFSSVGVQGGALKNFKRSGGAQTDSYALDEDYSQKDIYTLTDNVPLASGDASIRAMVTQMLDDTPSATESIMRELVEHLDIPDTASEDSFEYIYDGKQQKHVNREGNL